MQCTMYSQHAAQNTDRTGENSCTSNPNKLNTPETETQSNTDEQRYSSHSLYTHAVFCPITEVGCFRLTTTD